MATYQMDPTGGNSLGYGVFLGHVEAFHLGEEIRSLVSDASPPENGSSFTALLGLQPTEGLELLHQPDSGHSQPPPLGERLPRCLDFGWPSTFPASASAPIPEAAGEGGAASEEWSENSSDPSVSGKISNQVAKVKIEADDSDAAFAFPSPESRSPPANNKRKESAENLKQVRPGGRKSKSVAEKLPYVHVRARRGQATDSHSLTERARREKINIRMKLLQELVPGCNKISGTALVLEEIINHVQSLQRQVEFLSMRLASVNPTIDFGLDGFFSGESGALASPTSGSGNGMGFESVPVWPEMQQQVNVRARRPNHQQLWHLTAPSSWGRDDARVFVNTDATTPTSTLG